MTPSAWVFSISNAVCMETTYDPDDQPWIVKESEILGSPSSHAWLRAFVYGWTRLAGWPFAVIEEHAIEAYSVRLLSRTHPCGDQTCWTGSVRPNCSTHVFHAILPQWVTEPNVTMSVLYNHMLMDQEPSVCSHVRKAAPWSDPTKLKTCLVMQRCPSRQIWNAMECWIEIDRIREGHKQPQ